MISPNNINNRQSVVKQLTSSMVEGKVFDLDSEDKKPKQINKIISVNAY